MNSKDMAEQLISKYGYLFFEYGAEDFLNLLQLETLKRIDNNFLANIDTEEVLRIAYRWCQEPTITEEYEEELRERENLIREAQRCIRRLNNEELRDIVFHHPMRDIQDPDMSDEEITRDNLVHVAYFCLLPRKIIDEERNTKRVLRKKVITEIKDVLKEYQCVYHIAEDDNGEVQIKYEL